MEIHDNDILILPENIEIPSDFEYQYHIMKFLHKPSIVFSQRGYMNTQTEQSTTTSKFINKLLGIMPKTAGEIPKETNGDIFLRHVRIRNPKNGEYYHNKGATFLVHLDRDSGSFLFSYATCNHEDNFNKLIANNVCSERMNKGEFIECINYDPSISIIQNIYLAIGVALDEYPLTEYDWRDIIPELTGCFTAQQKRNLKVLRKLIRSKLQGYKY